MMYQSLLLKVILLFACVSVVVAAEIGSLAPLEVEPEADKEINSEDGLSEIEDLVIQFQQFPFISSATSPLVNPLALLQNSIPEVLVRNPRTSIFAELVFKSGLEDALSGPGPFTLFAPSNEALGRLGPAVLRSVTRDIDRLQRLVAHHVVESELVPATALKQGLNLQTLDGDRLQVRVTKDNNTVTIDGGSIEGASIIETIRARNGIIHIINRAFMDDIVTVLDIYQLQEGLITLGTAIKTSGLRSILSQNRETNQPLTVFAPTDAAFAALPPGVLERLFANPVELRGLLLNHVLPDAVSSDDLARVRNMPSIGGGNMAIQTGPGILAVNNALIVKANIPASNGVIHKVDSILLPSVGLPPFFALPSGSSRRLQDPLFSSMDGMNRLNLLK